jgi:hypothetical protein
MPFIKKESTHTEDSSSPQASSRAPSQQATVEDVLEKPEVTDIEEEEFSEAEMGELE